MSDLQARLWSNFQKLAGEYPDCNAVKLTLEMQRSFILVQQQHFLQRVAGMVQPATDLTLS